MQHDLKTWLLAIDWIRRHRPSVVDEAFNAVCQKKPSEKEPSRFESSLELSPRGRQIYLKKFGGDEALLEERLALARDAYMLKTPDYRFRTPFITFFERRVEVDIKDMKKRGSIAPEPNSKQAFWQSQVLATVEDGED